MKKLLIIDKDLEKLSEQLTNTKYGQLVETVALWDILELVRTLEIRFKKKHPEKMITLQKIKKLITTL